MKLNKNYHKLVRATHRPNEGKNETDDPSDPSQKLNLHRPTETAEQQATTITQTFFGG